MRPDDRISIGDLAARAGVSVSAVRFYEDKGLVTPVRSAGGRRLFRRCDLRRISFVLIAQQLGFSLAEIKTRLAALPDERTPTQKDWAKIARTFRSDLDERIARLTRLRDNLDGCIGCGCLSLRKCALYNPADRASARGAGPRHIIDGPVDGDTRL